MEPFQPGDIAKFRSREDWVTGEVEEIKKGFEGDHLLFVRQGLPFLGEVYIVLSSYAEKQPTKQPA